MSEEEKEASAPRLGVRSIRSMSPAARFLADRRAKQEQSKAEFAHDAESEWLERFTQELAQELMSTYSPEQIADIAARQMIGVDYFRSRARKADEAVTTAVDAYRSQLAEKRADAVKRAKADVIKHAREIAAQKWAEDADETIKVGVMAGVVYDILVNAHPRNLISSVTAVKRWISPVTPPYASQPGPRKNR